MENDGSVDSLADRFSVAQLALPLVSDHTDTDERRRLKPLRRERTPELLGRHFVLSATDLEETRRCRGDENKLGFALTLLLVRFLNSAAVSLERVPEAVVDFVSSQVEVEPAALAVYGKRRPQTRDDHAKRIRRYLGGRAFVHTDGEPLLEFLNNPFASVVNGELKLSEDEKVEILESAKELRKKVVALLPKVSLADLLIEVDSWVEIRKHFTHAGQINAHPTGTSARIGSPSDRGSLLDTCIFAVLVARGCNLPLNRIADASGIPYHNLVHTADWYFGEECIREAIVALVNYHHSLPISSAFGAGTTAMSDGIRFGVSARSLYARPNPRYFGATGRGVTVYDTTSDQYSSPYVQVIRCNLREAVAVLDGILHHETELPLHESVVDTHGYTESLFGLFELESKVFSPRIADLPDQRIYPMEKRRRGRPPKGGREPRYGELDALLRGPAIKRDLIRDCWDDMHKVAASLKDGTTSATLLVSKLNNLKRKSSVQQAIQELGRLQKSFFYLDYISDESLRLRIRRALNKGELLHSLARDLFFGQQGLFRERDYEAQLNRQELAPTPDGRSKRRSGP